YPELRARVEALLRRADLRRRPGRLRVGALELDVVARVVRLGGAPVDLSQKEFALLRALVSEPTRVFTKDELLRVIWGFRALGSAGPRASHACRRARSPGRDGARFVVNVWGVGSRPGEGAGGPVSFEPAVVGGAAAPPFPPAAAAALAPPLLAVARPL